MTAIPHDEPEETFPPPVVPDVPGYHAEPVSHFSVQVCDRCGAVVIDTETHDRWHPFKGA